MAHGCNIANVESPRRISTLTMETQMGGVPKNVNFLAQSSVNDYYGGGVISSAGPASGVVLS